MTNAILHEALTDVPNAPRTTPRDRLMQAATRLFCKHGINATGIDAIVHEAGTAKTTLYKLFGSKSDLVEAVLQSESLIWRAWFIAAVEAAGGSPRARLDAIFPVLKSWFSEEDYYGCVFINAVGEHDKDETRLRAITLQHKSFVLAHVAGLARAAGAADPEALAHQLGILMDGAIVAAMVTRDPGIADAAGIAANALLNEACGRAPRKARPRSSIKVLAPLHNLTTG
ncbi:MAG: putative Transcriptional regulatory protein TetR family [Bradyrhizobium sp.]|nr:putative Transcriptional regulatory protein TetR family [Bradyrhizobium sp.]